MGIDSIQAFLTPVLSETIGTETSLKLPHIMFINAQHAEYILQHTTY